MNMKQISASVFFPLYLAVAPIASALEGHLHPTDGFESDLPEWANQCWQGQVKFDGRCRGTAFFNRFLTAGASLIGVAGPPGQDSSDTGVIVLEALSENAYNLLYLLPDKALPGGIQSSEYQYRADYPMVFQQRITTWQDDQGYLHLFSEDHGPAAGPGGYLTFGIRGWSHYVPTPSGYEFTNSDGHTGGAWAASGESGGYCEFAASVAGWAATAAAIGGSEVVGAVSGTALGIATGAVVFAVGTSGTFGVGGPEAFLAGVGVGVTVGGAWFGVFAAGGIAISGPTGELVTEGVEKFVCNYDNLDLADFEFLPMVLSVPVYPAPTTGECPAGMVLYTGQATQCTESSNNTIVDGIETINVSMDCDTVWVSQQCAAI